MASDAKLQLRGFIKAGALVGLLRAAAMLSMLAFVSLLSTWMSPAEFGALALILSLATLGAGFGSFGQAELAIRSIASRKAAGDAAALVEVPNETLGLVVWVSVGVGAAIATYLGWSGYAVATCLASFVLTIAFSVMTALAGAARADNRFALALVPKDIAWRLLALVAVGAIVLAGGIAEAGLVFPIVALSALVCAAMQGQRLKFRLASLLYPARRVRDRQYLSSSATLAISMLALVALGTLDIVVVGSRISPEAAAAYFPASRIALLAAFASFPIQTVAEQRFAELLARSDLAGAQRQANIATVLQFLLSVALGIAVLACFPIYAFLFPTATSETFLVLTLLVTGSVVGSLAGLAGPLLVMSGNQSLVARTNLGFAAIALVLLLLASAQASLVAIALVMAGVEISRKAILGFLAYRQAGILPFAREALTGPSK